MIQFHVFPGGKKRIVTFSYDDGYFLDERLIGLFNQYGVKGTFHLNGRNFMDSDEEKIASLRKLYEGHEIACHTMSHGWPARMPKPSVVAEVWEDRKVLERIFQYPIVGMSYPSGSFDDSSISAMEACGIVYSRTVLSTGDFVLPENFMKWHPSCHHNAALPLCERFMKSLTSEWTHPLFYIWGHSHELRTEENWDHMEKVIAAVAGNDKIWYATNIEIYDYMMAQRSLRISADETVFTNPTAMTLWVERNKTDIIEIPAGQTIVVK